MLKVCHILCFWVIQSALLLWSYLSLIRPYTIYLSAYNIPPYLHHLSEHIILRYLHYRWFKDTCKPCILISRYCNYWKNRFRHEASKTAPAGIRTTFILSFLHIQQAGMSFFHSSLPVIILLFYLLFFRFFICQNLLCHFHLCFFILRKNDIQDDCE